MLNRRHLAVGATAVLVLAGPLIVAWTLQPARSAGPCTLVSGPTALPEIPETSGLAIGRRNPGILWSHNDSGNVAMLFAMDTAGAMLGRVRLPVKTRDWEDISAARCGAADCLYIADIGDNRAARPHISIYRVPEPAPGDAQTAAPEVFTAAYADGPHNAEAMFVAGDDVFIITRDRIGLLYKGTPAAGRALTFQRIGQLGLTTVTDAETSRDGASVAVRTSHEVALYRTTDLIRGVTTPYLRIPIDGLRELQGEGVALDGPMLYLSSEAGGARNAGRILRLRCELPAQ